MLQRSVEYSNMSLSLPCHFLSSQVPPENHSLHNHIQLPLDRKHAITSHVLVFTDSKPTLQRYHGRYRISVSTLSLQYIHYRASEYYRFLVQCINIFQTKCFSIVNIEIVVTVARTISVIVSHIILYYKHCFVFIYLVKMYKN